jgi:hypothetical protein
MKKTIGRLLILILPFAFSSLVGIISGQWEQAMFSAAFIDVILIFAVIAVCISEYFFND